MHATAANLATAFAHAKAKCCGASSECGARIRASQQVLVKSRDQASYLKESETRLRNGCHGSTLPRSIARALEPGRAARFRRRPRPAGRSGRHRSVAPLRRSRLDELRAEARRSGVTAKDRLRPLTVTSTVTSRLPAVSITMKTGPPPSPPGPGRGPWRLRKRPPALGRPTRLHHNEAEVSGGCGSFWTSSLQAEASVFPG